MVRTSSRRKMPARRSTRLENAATNTANAASTVAAQTPDSSASLAHPRLGAAVDVLWEDRDTVYSGVVAARAGRGRSSFLVAYDDGDRFVHNMDYMCWRYAATADIPASRWFEPGALSAHALGDLADASGGSRQARDASRRRSSRRSARAPRDTAAGEGARSGHAAAGPTDRGERNRFDFAADADPEDLAEEGPESGSADGMSTEPRASERASAAQPAITSLSRGAIIEEIKNNDATEAGAAAAHARAGAGSASATENSARVAISRLSGRDTGTGARATEEAHDVSIAVAATHTHARDADEEATAAAYALHALRGADARAEVMQAERSEAAVTPRSIRGAASAFDDGPSFAVGQKRAVRDERAPEKEMWTNLRGSTVPLKKRHGLQHTVLL